MKRKIPWFAQWKKCIQRCQFGAQITIPFLSFFSLKFPALWHVWRVSIWCIGIRYCKKWVINVRRETRVECMCGRNKCINITVRHDGEYVPRYGKYVPRHKKYVPRDGKYVPRHKKYVPRYGKYVGMCYSRNVLQMYLGMCALDWNVLRERKKKRICKCVL